MTKSMSNLSNMLFVTFITLYMVVKLLLTLLIRNVVHEIVIRLQGIAARVQQHSAVGADIAAHASRNGQDRIGAIVVVRPLDSDIAGFQEDRPEAPPLGLAGCHGVGVPVPPADSISCLHDSLDESGCNEGQAQGPHVPTGRRQRFLLHTPFD